ncbi:MAG: phosphatase PAP2 family protein [Chloroflexi bacterium]|nr:phosphatase PAP2 family protein [Chloroflexota bacterium]
MGDWIQTLNDASIPFLLWLQSFRNPALDGYMMLMSWLGSEFGYLFFFPFLYWAVNKRWGALAGLALLFSVLIGDFIKWTFRLPRPASPPVQRLWEETSPGFVSTHASSSMAVFGTLARLARQTWFTIAAIVLILSIGFSRMYLGVHFPADVVGGWLVGLFTVWVIMRLLPRLEPTVLSWSPARQIVAVFVAAALVLLIFPGDWEGNRPASSAVSNVGVLMGLFLGLIWDHRRLHFQVSGSWPRRIARYVVGMVLVALVYFGLSFAFASLGGAYWLEQGLRLIRYMLVGLVISGVAPWLFFRIRLA